MTYSSEKRVMEFIEQNFHMSGIKITDMKIVPGGKVITDIDGGEMLVYLDILTDKIVTEIK